MFGLSRNKGSEQWPRRHDEGLNEVRPFAVLVLAVIMVGVVIAHLAPTTTSSTSNPTTTQNGGHVGRASLYPDRKLTPGDTFPGVTAQEVCTPGYSKNVRSVSSAEKKEVLQRYGVNYPQGTYEVDHFISLELGGSNAVTNLWPEPYEPRPGARDKDKVENYLHQQVCNGSMTLQQAQDAIRTDWYKVYEQLPNNS